MPEPDTLPATVPQAIQPMQGQDAAALLLMLFGEEEAANILTRLEPSEIQSLGEAMFAIANVTESDVNNVFDRFIQKASGRTTIGYQADQQINNMMSRALGPDRAQNMLGRISPTQSGPELEQLKWMATDEIARMVDREHPQIIAVVISYLSPERAGKLISLLPEQYQDDVVYRVATMKSISPAALAEVENLISESRSTARASGIQKNSGPPEAAAIMNNIAKIQGKQIIKALSKRDKKLARSIEEQMFVFSDLIELDDKNLGTLLRSVENDDLILALKGADAPLADKMLGCMSSRAAQSIQDELEELGPVSKEDVVAAQKQIISQARALEDDGTIILGGGEDGYV